MRSISPIAAGILCAALAAGCAGFGVPDGDDALLAAEVALEYQAARQAELADGGEEALLSDTAAEASRALVAEGSPARASGTAAATVEELSDGSGNIRVTASWTDDDGLEVVSVIVRARRPSAYETDVVARSGWETRTVGGVLVRNVQAIIEWKWDATAGRYFRYRLTRTGERYVAVAGLGIDTVIEWNAAGELVSRRVEWIDLDAPDGPALRGVEYSPLLDGTGAPVLNESGQRELKMVFDGRDGWAVLVSRRSPRVVEHYRGDATLALRVTHDPTPGVPGVAILREHYAADGATLLRSVEGSMRMAANEDGSLTITRQVGSRKIAARIAESAAGLEVSIGADEWTVVLNDDGSLDLGGPDGSAFHVSFAADGHAVVTGA